MGIRMVAKGQYHCPQFHCDACGEVIIDSGNYEYPWIEGDEGSHTNEVYYSHKGVCSHVVEQRFGEGRLWCTNELSCLPLYLLNNAKIPVAKAQRTLKMMHRLGETF